MPRDRGARTHHSWLDSSTFLQAELRPGGQGTCQRLIRRRRQIRSLRHHPCPEWWDLAGRREGQLPPSRGWCHPAAARPLRSPRVRRRLSHTGSPCGHQSSILLTRGVGLICLIGHLDGFECEDSWDESWIVYRFIVDSGEALPHSRQDGLGMSPARSAACDRAVTPLGRPTVSPAHARFSRTEPHRR